MKDIHNELKEMFNQGRFTVLATIIRQGGPTPRGTGTKCLILDDGSLVGTIGGGLLEAQVLEEAAVVFETGLPVRLYYSLKGKDVAETDMLCGGDVEVFLEPVPPESLSHLTVLQEVVRVNNLGGAALLATVLDRDRWLFGNVPKAFLDRDGRRVGSILGEQEIEDALAARIDEIVRSGQPMIIPVSDDEGNRIEVFVEPISSTPVLYVFGGGHVSRQIVPLASRVGFNVVVMDDREDFAVPEDFPGAQQVLTCPFESVMETLPVDESSFLVIVTRGHMHDKMVLAQALKTEAGYVGMIGSDRKRRIIYEKLEEEGFTKKELSRVYSPIGLEIGADTPEEIAVSIVAELIKVRAGKD
jgi:xanthine dehydrogenase accessory factor